MFTPLALALRSMNCSGVPPASCAAGVAHDASCTVVGRSWPVFTRRLPPLAPSLALAVGQDASATAACRVSCALAPDALTIPAGGSTVPRAVASGVGHAAVLTMFFRSLPPCANVGAPPPLASPDTGVAQCASLATSFNGRALSPCLLLADDFQSLAVAVGQHASFAAPANLSVGVSWFPFAYE